MLSNSNIAAKLPLEHRERDTFTRTFVFQKGELAEDVSGWAFVFRVRVPGGLQPIEKTIGAGLSRPDTHKLKIDPFQLGLVPGKYQWELEADLPGGAHRTLFSDLLTVVGNSTAA